MLLADLVSTSARVGATRARSEKTAHLAALLRRLGPREVDVAVAFLSGRLRRGRIGLGWAALREARAGTRPAESPSLTLLDVDASFDRVAAVSGRGSASERARRLGELFGRATGEEQDFLVRLVLGELRQGALAGLMEEALAQAAGVPAVEVRRALLLAGDLQAVAQAVLSEGRTGLARFRLELLRPLQPMLAQPAEDLDAALARLGDAALEWKLDGARVQVHRLDDEVRVFSRRLHDVTAAVPELVEAVRALPAKRLILDGETIALRPDGSPQPFQVTMRRFGRKLEVERLRQELPLSSLFFDALHWDGEDLLDRPAEERFGVLAAGAPAELVVPRLRTADPAAAQAFLDGALGRGHEGIMVKDPAATYDAGRRGFAWLKVKPAQTLDLVVLAAEWGHGRRRGWLSNLHLGARDPENGGFVMLGKTFKGMTDEVLAWQTEKLLSIAMARDEWTVHVRPELVVEIAFSDLQESPHYPGGLALRFARLKRYRTDKTAAESDTIATVRALFARQRGATG
ncbi:MAG TPA: ATP-dependent DNA ligase [Thermoanaerobaculia bacterium]|nr:ATP-dependent DNA ligase [Thermoanaerobaculia bacterium]